MRQADDRPHRHLAHFLLVERMNSSLKTSFCLAALLIATGASADDDLTGLWKAKRRFGPDTRGALIIRRDGGDYVADLAGRSVPVRLENGELTFRAPNGDSRFLGKCEPDNTILGHWVKGPTAVDIGEMATTVLLLPDGSNRWRGRIEPLQDEFTCYLSLKRSNDSTYAALLRNIERDIGTQFGVERLAHRGNALKLLGKRGGKEMEVAPGAYDTTARILSLFFANRGGTYDFVRDDDASDFYPRGKLPSRYVYRQPLALDDGWSVGTLDEARIDRPAIEKFVQSILDASMDSRDAPQVHALLIARHGKLVLEEYFHGDTREKLHETRSAGKSVTSVVVGAAIHAGAPLALTSKVYEVMNGGAFPADLQEQKRELTLGHLLTMSSGYFCDDSNDSAPGNEETMTNQTEEPDFYRFTLQVPLATRPGENAVYCSASPNLALGLVGRAVGESPMYTFDRLVARPMSITDYAWGLDPVGHPYGGGGVRLRARDFMKFGQLMLDGGKWRGHAVVSAEYAKNATAALYHLRNLYYGYLWWGENYPYKSRTVYAYSARGNGGQTVTVVPALDIIICTMTGNYFSRKGMFAASTDPIPRSILPAVRERGDDPSAPVVEREYKSPYGPSTDGSRVQKP